MPALLIKLVLHDTSVIVHKRNVCLLQIHYVSTSNDASKRIRILPHSRSYMRCPLWKIYLLTWYLLSSISWIILQKTLSASNRNTLRIFCFPNYLKLVYASSVCSFRTYPCCLTLSYITLHTYRWLSLQSNISVYF